MLPLIHKLLFFAFALLAGGLGAWGFWRLYRRVTRGRPAVESRLSDLPGRLWYALRVSLTQERTFRRRSVISTLHSFIFYGFVYYLLVNVIDGLEGYLPIHISSSNPLGAVYNLLADVLSFLVLFGVIALVIRRFALPARRDFRFNEKTLLHPAVKKQYISRDSIIVSSFILFHVGSRVIGQGAKLAQEGRDGFQPFGSLVSRLFTPENAEFWRLFGYWGALGSVLAFLAYFPYTKHIHIFMAPVNYFFKRPEGSGVLPPMKVDLEAEHPEMGAETLSDLEWPRLLDAYACIQCNRCQDVCPASATGKALSPAALEINKRMELNALTAHASPFTLQLAPFETGAVATRPLLEFALSPEAAWACTTCGACMQVCPTQDEQMLDIIDIRRQQVMVEGEFPAQLQSAFRGMERAANPWGLSRDKRLEWAEGLKVPTIDENPEPDVIYWVGCAASYDPGAQKVARSFVQLLDKAGVNYAVLGKKEACTGDPARRAGNEFLYQQLATENVETLNSVRPKLIVATCPHCMNAIGHEYKQLGGDYRTIHHTEYLETLVAQGKLQTAGLDTNVTYHDPCYLGRHNGVYDAPRQLITQMAGEVLELERHRDNSFCCGAGGAQFWKEEEAGDGRISDNRFAEIQARLDSATENAKSGKVLAVGCPFCKSMLNSTPTKQSRDDIVIKDVAELMLESVLRQSGDYAEPTGPVPDASPIQQPEVVSAPIAQQPVAKSEEGELNDDAPGNVVGETSAEVMNAQPEPRKAWKPKAADDVGASPVEDVSAVSEAPARKAWKPKGADVAEAGPAEPAPTSEAPARKAWKPKASADDVSPAPVEQAAPSPAPAAGAPARKAWNPKGKTGDVKASATPVAEVQPAEAAPAPETPARPVWKPMAQTPPATPTEAAPTEASPAATSERPKWQPKRVAAAPAQESAEVPIEAGAVAPTPAPANAPTPAARPKWNPKGTTSAPSVEPVAPQSQPVVVQAEDTLAQIPSEEPVATLPPAPSDPASGEAPARKKWEPKNKG